MPQKTSETLHCIKWRHQKALIAATDSPLLQPQTDNNWVSVWFCKFTFQSIYTAEPI